MTPPARAAPRRAILGWMLFDWAAQPYFTLVTTFVFAPYFVSALASDPAAGQAMWGYATGFAGLCIALLSPVLGAVADAGGPRKPWIAAFSVLLVIGSASLWYAAPGLEYAVLIALGGFVLGTIGAEFATVFNNAMLPTLVPRSGVGRLSGNGWAMGYAGGLLSLVLVLGFVAASPVSGVTLMGRPPILGLDAASREGDRFAGPLAAVWYVAFVLPLFLFVPDRPRRLALAPAVRAGLAGLSSSLAGLRSQPALARFLLANMIYADALVALFAFGGVYAAGTFGWGTVQIGVFGILLTIAGTFGAIVGGRLDDTLGPKRVILGSLAVLLLASLGIAGTTRDTVFFVMGVEPPGNEGRLFAATAEQVYLALGLLIGLVAGPLQAASRSMLIRLARPDAVGTSFGLLALSGKVTSFAGPTLVAIATSLAASQRAGVAVLIAMLVAGTWAMAGVREPRGVDPLSDGSAGRL